METVVSGIRSTGKLHLGNFYGAVKNFVQMQNEFNCYFFIADFHSLTTHPTPDDLHGNVKQVLIEYLAAGIDPEFKSTSAKDYWEKYLTLTEATPEKYKKNLVNTYNYLAQYWIKNDNNSKAKEYFTKALILDPENKIAKDYLKQIK
jgi:tetratricopeptide (TPR) repeat protein